MNTHNNPHTSTNLAGQRLAHYWFGGCTYYNALALSYGYKLKNPGAVIRHQQTIKV